MGSILQKLCQPNSSNVHSPNSGTYRKDQEGDEAHSLKDEPLQVLRGGLRLDQYLALEFPHQSRTYFQRLIEEGLVLVNGQNVKKRTLLEIGDSVEVEFALTPELDLEPEEIPLDVVFEDEHLIVINKPPGLVVHPAPGHWKGTFVNALLFHCKGLERTEKDLRPGIVHRLDKDTSGLLVAAKTAASHRKLVEAFASRAVFKEYEAIVSGHPAPQTIDKPIGRDPKDRKKMAALESGGKHARTEIKPLQTFKEFSLISARLHTGRTHQIRVHLKAIGHPIVGDILYGFKALNVRLAAKRQMLHAKRLKFQHPLTGRLLEFEVPRPIDMELILKKL